MLKISTLIFLLLVPFTCFAGDEYEEKNITTNNVEVLSTSIDQLKQRHVTHGGRLKIETICIDGYKFAVASSIEIVRGRDGVGGGVSMVQMYETANGAATPMKCSKKASE